MGDSVSFLMSNLLHLEAARLEAASRGPHRPMSPFQADILQAVSGRRRSASEFAFIRMLTSILVSAGDACQAPFRRSLSTPPPSNRLAV